MHCPRCQSVGLHTGQAEALTVRACGHCGGVWLDPPDADKLLSWVQVQAWQEPVQVRCATCQHTMQGRYLPEANVVVDHCEGHGVWFDHRELEQLAGVVARKRGRSLPEFPRPQAAAAGVALAGAVAASAVTAVAMAGGEEGEQSDGLRHAGDVAIEAAVIAPEVATTGLDVVTSVTGDSGIAEGSGELAEGAVDVAGGAVEGGAEALAGGAEVAGGFVEGIAEVLGGLLS